MNTLTTSIILIGAGFLPSYIWLIYYLRKDCHPEPKSMIAKAMIFGILVAPLAVFAELAYTQTLQYFRPGYNSSSSYSFFLWAAFVEEYVKYLAIRYTILRSPEFDEPTDAMIYMISASLGFAAIENILVLFRAVPDGFHWAMQIWLLRFTGATLLHAVSAALTGYFLALSWFYRQHSSKLIVFGIATATFAHFVFNISLLSTSSQTMGFVYSTIGLIATVILVSFLFNRIKKRMAEHSTVGNSIEPDK